MSAPSLPLPPQATAWGDLLGSVAHRWARLVAAVVIVIMAARTRFAPLAYIVLVFAAGTVFLSGSQSWADKATSFWAPKPPAAK